MPTKDQFDRLIDHRIGLDQFSTGVIKKIDILLRKTQKDISDKIDRALRGVNERGDSISPPSRRRLKELQATISQIQNEGHVAILDKLQGNSLAIAANEAEFAKTLYESGASGSITLHKPSAQMLKSVVYSKPFQGATLRQWASKMKKQQLDRIWQHIQIGIVEGEDTKEIVRRLEGTGALRFKDGQFAKDRRNAEGLVRTAINHVTNRAHMAFILENPDIFPRYRWVSVLDSRTTPICRSRAGRSYKNNGRNPVPPAHWNCRSTIVGITWFDNNQDSELTFDEWLNGQSSARKIEILGPKRAKLHDEGVSVRRFVAGSGKPLTLEQLKQRDHKTWIRAGLN